MLIINMKIIQTQSFKDGSSSCDKVSVQSLKIFDQTS